MTDLSQLKVGDKVCLQVTGGWGRSLIGLRVGAVEKVTATQITAFGERWMARHGFKVGAGRYDREFLQIWTPELQAEADLGADRMKAERLCYVAAQKLERIRGDEAIRIAALLPAELTQEQPK